ncbi:MAG: hypothetical protein WCA12_21080 [Burkholderiales bacterium]
MSNMTRMRETVGNRASKRFALVRDRGEERIAVDLSSAPMFRSLEELLPALPRLVGRPGRYHVVEFNGVPRDDREVVPGELYRGEVLASFRVPLTRWLLLRTRLVGAV